MNTKEAKDMMQRCIGEIEGLRRERDSLRPHAEAYRTIQQIMSYLPQPSQGYGEDLVWRLRKRIEELEKEENVNPT